MSVLDQEFHRRLLKRIDGVDNTKTEHIRSGVLGPEQYKHDTGYLKALDDVREWCKQIEIDISEGK